MRLVYTGFVFLLVFFLLSTNDTFPPDPALADVRLFLLGVGMIAVVSFFSFMYGVWKKGAQKGFQFQEVKAKTSKTPFEVMRESYMMLGLILIFSIAAIAITMEYMGYHDELVAIKDWLIARGSRIFGILFGQ